MSGLAPIFVGGTGRSGTTIVARLLAEQPGYILVPIELRVHAAPGGLADLLEGRVELEWFVARLRDFWYERRSASGEPGGLARICPRERFDVAVDEFAKGFGSDPLGAAEVFVHRTVAPVMEASEASGWVEMTPHNSAAASTLARVFPQARFVHVTRCGLDVATSLRDTDWAPDDVRDCLLWWEDRLLASHRGMTGVPRARCHTVGLEELVGPERDSAHTALVKGLSLPESRAMEVFLEARMTADRAGVGRWRDPGDPGDPDARALCEVHRHATRRLTRAGIGQRRSPPPSPAAGRSLALRSRLVRLRWRLWRRRAWSWRRPAWRRWAARARARVAGWR